MLTLKPSILPLDHRSLSAHLFLLFLSFSSFLSFCLGLLQLAKVPLREDIGKAFAPPALGYHTAVLMDNSTMVVYGGNDHVHYKEEVCYHYAVYAYHIDCNVWTPAAGGPTNTSASF